MKEVGFDGYSIAELLNYTEGLKIFRFLGFPSRQLQGVQELGFAAVFDDEAAKKETISRLDEVWNVLPGKKPGYYWSADEIYNEPLGVHFRFVKAPDAFEEEDFQFGRMLESEILPFLRSVTVKISDQQAFKFRGFDRSRYK